MGRILKLVRGFFFPPLETHLHRWNEKYCLQTIWCHKWRFLFQCLQPVSEEFQNGEGFGYIVAFRANGTRGWKEKMVTSADSTTYKYRDETFPPLTPFEVKVGVYNNKGDGPFSKVVIIYSAEGGEWVRMCYSFFITFTIWKWSRFLCAHRAERGTNWCESLQYFCIGNKSHLETTESWSWTAEGIWGLYDVFSHVCLILSV